MVERFNRFTHSSTIVNFDGLKAMATERNNSQRLAYSIREVGRLLGVGKNTVCNLLDTGELERVKIGKRTLIRAADLEALIARGRTNESSLVRASREARAHKAASRNAAQASGNMLEAVDRWP
jgi:excisionase family DNA binding protein